jgi:hypothetical protein
MIISASRRTDIPAFFGEWFMNRIRAGFFYRVNPFNAKQIKEVSLLPSDVDVIVFWSKNPQPFVKYLDELDDRGYRYYFQFTLNDYPYEIEGGLPAFAERLETFISLSRRIGAQRVIWRYDPIIITDMTPVDYHIDRYGKIAEYLKDSTSRSVISYMDLYGKVSTRWQRLDFAESYRDITKSEDKSELHRLVKAISQNAAEQGMEVFTCAEELNLDDYNIRHGSCIDQNLINDIFNLNLAYPKDKNQRETCLCATSVDVGMYSTCQHLCSYCYANRSEKEVGNNIKEHKVDSPMLVGEIDV